MIDLDAKLRYKASTEEEAKNFIERCKQEAEDKGYTIDSYTSQYKEKKSKGEIIDYGYQVTIVKKFNDFWEADV